MGKSLNKSNVLNLKGLGFYSFNMLPPILNLLLPSSEGWPFGELCSVAWPYLLPRHQLLLPFP